ncbi:hypothetical protein BpHYR1_006992 [Brachionus plicatilis]|uniref:Uncharacterized protein n=1 Tax=Brachionus plicatilis TaxID=10195 RepID=A0A3M7S361_BRAPC|nr:hypothetical protein BpHYR1_006992 [Brachionus plicatilis]
MHSWSRVRAISCNTDAYLNFQLYENVFKDTFMDSVLRQAGPMFRYSGISKTCFSILAKRSTSRLITSSSGSFFIKSLKRPFKSSFHKNSKRHLDFILGLLNNSGNKVQQIFFFEGPLENTHKKNFGICPH